MQRKWNRIWLSNSTLVNFEARLVLCERVPEKALFFMNGLDLKECFLYTFVCGVTMKTICYLDMDDVLADFNRQAYRYIQYDCRVFKNKPFCELTDEERLMQKRLFSVCDYDDTFWQTMPMKSGALDLYQLCRSEFDDVVLLSKFVPPTQQPRRFRAVSFLKLKWAHHFLSEDGHLPKVVVIDDVKSLLLQNRKDICQILIDDMIRNVSDWQEKGGVGVLYHDNQQVMQELMQIKHHLPQQVIQHDMNSFKLKGFSHEKE